MAKTSNYDIVVNNFHCSYRLLCYDTIIIKNLDLDPLFLSMSIMNFIKRTRFQNDVLLIAVGLVGAFGALTVIYGAVASGDRGLLPENYNITAKKSQILAMVESRDLLTNNEKEIIGKELIGEKVKMYHFTEKEIGQILNALNKD